VDFGGRGLFYVRLGALGTDQLPVDDVVLAPFDAVVHHATEGMADQVESLSAVVRARAEGAAPGAG